MHYRTASTLFAMTMFVLILLMILTIGTIVQGAPIDEVNEWRRRAGLRAFIEDPQMTEFAQMKAHYRAQRGLKDGHQGPQPPGGWTEGTGEATPFWGWLTCAIECDYRYAGAGMCIGRDGERYMVLVLRGGSGRELISPHNIPTWDTSAMTPRPVRWNDPVITRVPYRFRER